MRSLYIAVCREEQLAKKNKNSRRRLRSRSQLPRRLCWPLCSRVWPRWLPTPMVKVRKNQKCWPRCNTTVDLKNTLCAYFKAGVCEKGKKCKYSHDLSLEDSRTIAIDLYADPRIKTGNAPDTIITCRDFIDAVERNLYGFNWTCPNGGDQCTYAHRLP